MRKCVTRRPVGSLFQRYSRWIMSCVNAVFGCKNSSGEEKVHLYLVLHETRVWFIKLEDYTLGVYSPREKSMKSKRSTSYICRFHSTLHEYQSICRSLVWMCVYSLCFCRKKNKKRFPSWTPDLSFPFGHVINSRGPQLEEPLLPGLLAVFFEVHDGLEIRHDDGGAAEVLLQRKRRGEGGMKEGHWEELSPGVLSL